MSTTTTTPTPTSAYPSPVFAPTPDLHDLALRELTDPTQSLCDVAETLHITVSALALWMAKPEIAEQLDAVDSAAARQARSCATHHLPRAVDALVMILQAYTGHERTSLPKPGTPAFENLRHHREGARRAAALLHRIANFHPSPPRPRRSPSDNSDSSHSPPRRVDVEMPSARTGEVFASSPFSNSQAPTAPPTAPASERPAPASASASLASPPAPLPTSPSPLLSSISEHEQRIKNLLALRAVMHSMAPGKKPPAPLPIPLPTLQAIINAANPPEDDDDPDLNDEFDGELDQPDEDPGTPPQPPRPPQPLAYPPPGAFIMDPTLPRDPDVIFEDDPP